MTLTHRQRVLTTLDHEEPDRVPWDLWAAPEVMQRLREHLDVDDDEAVLRHFDVDLRTIRGPSYAGQAMRTFPGGVVEDLWGVKREVITVESRGFRWSYKHVVEHPLAEALTVADVERYPGWPDPAGWDFSAVADECRACGDCAVVNRGDRLDRTAQLKPAMYLRGVEQILVDLAMNEAVAEAIFQKVYEYFMSYNRRVFEAAASSSSPLPTAGLSRADAREGEGKGEGGMPTDTAGQAGRGTRTSLIDLFMMGDDFGTQHGPIVSPDMWRRFFKRRFRDFIDLAHAFGIRVMHHTCGSVRALIPEFIDCGLDVLQSVQPQAAGMDLGELKREFGRDLAFHGSVDIQGALPRGTPAQVREEVKTRLAAGKPGGGFIISTAHNILPDTPTENILALFEAYREYGAYEKA